MKNYWILIYAILLIVVGTAEAQLSKMQVVGTPEKSGSELVGVRDANGRFCAAIQVISDMDGFNYDAYNGIVKVDDLPGKDMVYIAPDERILLIMRSGFEPLKIVLSELGIQLKPKDVWMIKLEGDADNVPWHAIITSSPSDVSVFLNGEKLGTTPLFTEFKSGEYKLKLTKVGYREIVKTISVEPGVVFRDYIILEPTEFGFLDIKNEGKATIVIDGKALLYYYKEKEFRLLPGEHKLVASKPHYYTKIIPFTIEAGETIPFDIVLKLRKGQLKIQTNSDDPSAVVKANGEIIGYVREKPFFLAEGKYIVEIEKPGYMPYSKGVKIIPKNRTLIKPKLISIQELLRTKSRLRSQRNWAFAGTVIIGGTAAVLHYLVERSYSDYKSALTTAEASSAREKVEDYQLYRKISLGGAGFSLFWAVLSHIRQHSIVIDKSIDVSVDPKLSDIDLSVNIYF